MLDQHPLISFFNGTGSDPKGRWLSEIVLASDRWLEREHDYIQTLFPLPEGSMFWEAWVVTEAVFDAFRSSSKLRAAQREAFERMLKFYGFQLVLVDGKPACEKLSTFGLTLENQGWLRKTDHNHLRITRIIRSLRVLGLEDDAQAFFDAVSQVQAEPGIGIGEISLMFWRRAMQRPLNIAPDVRDSEFARNTGERFLRDFEEKRGRSSPLNGGHISIAGPQDESFAKDAEIDRVSMRGNGNETDNENEEV